MELHNDISVVTVHQNLSITIRQDQKMLYNQEFLKIIYWIQSYSDFGES